MDNWQRNSGRSGFTRTDLCVATMVVALLLCLSLPALAKMQPRSQRASCANNLCQLSTALTMYTSDNDNLFPVKPAVVSNGIWPTKLLPYFKDLRVLACPSDQLFTFNTYSSTPADRAPRSYLINGWNDYFAEVYHTRQMYLLSMIMSTNGMPVRSVLYPTETIALGEKNSFSMHYYMDFLESISGNEITEVEQGRHGADHQISGWSGSNHAFVDGTVRFLKYGEGLSPVNRWAVMDQWRTNVATP